MHKCCAVVLQICLKGLKKIKRSWQPNIHNRWQVFCVLTLYNTVGWHQPFTWVQPPPSSGWWNYVEASASSSALMLLSQWRWQQHDSLNTTVKPQSSSVKTQKTIRWSIPNIDLRLYNWLCSCIYSNKGTWSTGTLWIQLQFCSMAMDPPLHFLLKTSAMNSQLFLHNTQFYFPNSSLLLHKFHEWRYPYISICLERMIKTIKYRSQDS